MLAFIVVGCLARHDGSLQSGDDLEMSMTYKRTDVTLRRKFCRTRLD
jgi:hypothetical protein